MTQQDALKQQAKDFIEDQLHSAESDASDGGWTLYHALVEHIFWRAKELDFTTPPLSRTALKTRADTSSCLPTPSTRVSRSRSFPTPKGPRISHPITQSYGMPWSGSASAMPPARKLTPLGSLHLEGA